MGDRVWRVKLCERLGEPAKHDERRPSPTRSCGHRLGTARDGSKSPTSNRRPCAHGKLSV